MLSSLRSFKQTSSYQSPHKPNPDLILQEPARLPAVHGKPSSWEPVPLCPVPDT